jgi:hypothetical protein
VTNELVTDVINKLALNEEQQATLKVGEQGETMEDAEEIQQSASADDAMIETQPETQQETTRCRKRKRGKRQ